ncbi:MAG: AraC family transcriptional regulator [Bacteroidales bacterium]|nr:AraC family transcriptional regulator [Bacteroidales bacterium]
MKDNKETYKGDPSELVQYFPKFNLQLLCCRYWWLKNWEYPQLDFPFWRVYYNSKKGGFIKYDNIEYEMLPNHVYLIAPNTSYSSHLFNHSIPKSSYVLNGGRISDLSSELTNNFKKDDFIEHLFIHFTVGYPYDNIKPQIFVFELEDYLKTKVDFICKSLSKQAEKIDFSLFMAVQSLILELFFKMDSNIWNNSYKDERVGKAISFIENNLDRNISNEELAQMTYMATNAFARLFKEETGITIQKFIKNKKIKKACLFLLHTNYSIEMITEKTGFANRYHFTRVFHEITGCSPIEYKKNYLVPTSL